MEKTSKKRKAINYIADITAMVISSSISLLVTRFIIQNLSLSTYGVLALVINIGNIVIILANALSGAAARYVTLDLEKGHHKSASRYFSNTFFSIVLKL